MPGFFQLQPHFVESMVIRGDTGYYFLAKCQIKKKVTLSFFVNTEAYGAGNFKTPLLLHFDPISVKLPWLGYHGGMLAVTFPGNLQCFKKNVAL